MGRKGVEPYPCAYLALQRVINPPAHRELPTQIDLSLTLPSVICLGYSLLGPKGKGEINMVAIAKDAVTKLLTVDANALAELNNHANAGNQVAKVLQTLLSGTRYLELTAAAPSGGTCVISGAVMHLDGSPLRGAVDIVANSYPVAGAGTMVVGGGNAIVGSGTKSVWVQTAIDGTFTVTVTDATVGDKCLVQFIMDNGESASVALQF